LHDRYASEGFGNGADRKYCLIGHWDGLLYACQAISAEEDNLSVLNNRNL
jgi:hypothetical protein